MKQIDRLEHFLGHIAGGDEYLDDVDAICTRITELERERDEARAEIERLRRALIDARLMSGRKMPTSDEDKTDKAELAPYKSTICELLDEIKAMAHELAELRAEVERLKAKLGGPDYLLKLDTYEDTVRELMHEIKVRDRAKEIMDESMGDGCYKNGMSCFESTLAQARAELDGRARITSLLSGRNQSEPSPDADLIAPNSIDDAPLDQIIRVDEIEEAYHSADNSKLVFKEAKP